MPIIGMMMSLTSPSTILPKAAPMITPTARLSALPLRANSLNSFHMPQFPGWRGAAGRDDSALARLADPARNINKLEEQDGGKPSRAAAAKPGAMTSGGGLDRGRLRHRSR